MRKLLLSLTVLAFTVGLTLAAPVRFVKFDEKTKTLTVKPVGKKGEKGDEKEVDYKLTSKVKFTDENDDEVPFEKAIEKLSSDKVKGFDLKTSSKDDEKVESIKFTKGKGKKGGDKGGEKKEKKDA